MLQKRLQKGDILPLAWLGLPEPMIAENCILGGFEVINLDMQHGLHDIRSIERSMTGIYRAGGMPIARIPLGRFDMASRLVDMGAQGVIAPMINSVGDAKNFAATMKYPPTGERSWGPLRTMQLQGFDNLQGYLDAANGQTLAIAMIETMDAMKALDGILQVPGIDATFIGPGDLSISLSNGETIAGTSAQVMTACEEIIRKTRDAGKYACAFALTREQANSYIDMGAQLVAVGSDTLFIQNGVKLALEGVNFR